MSSSNYNSNIIPFNYNFNQRCKIILLEDYLLQIYNKFCHNTGTNFDYRAQLQLLLSDQWAQVTNEMDLHHHSDSSGDSHPIMDRLKLSLESLSKQGKSRVEALTVAKSAICSVLGAKWEGHAELLLEELQWKV